MTPEPAKRVRTADLEAARWYQRLGRRSADPQTLQAFFEWRAVPENAEAYRRAEAAWTGMEPLRADPEIRDTVAEAIKRGRNRDRRRRTRAVGLVGGLGLAVAGGLAAAVLWPASPPAYQTRIGEQKTVQLADGSTVRLDTNSLVRVAYSGGERRVFLDQGQALFEVAHDADRPFTVDVDGASVVARGTVFEVSRATEDLRVVLVSGVVDVTAGGTGAGAVRLSAGQEASVSDGRVERAQTDLNRAASWTQGRLIFADRPLVEAVAEVNRYLVHDIAVRAPDVGQTGISGVFRTGDGPAFAYAVAELLDLGVATGPRGELVLTARENNSGSTLGSGRG